MGQETVVVNEWLSDKVRFADLFNAQIFEGKQVVLPEDLELIDRTNEVLVEDKQGIVKGLERYRDVFMRWKKGGILSLLACENQAKVHYAMPVRNMIYDSLSYAEQIKNLWEMHKGGKRKLTSEEFLSRFRKEDKLYPILSIVLYYGKEEWDGCTDLHGMLQLEKGSILEKYIPNYHINLANVEKIENLSYFNTDLQNVFGMLKYRKDKEKLMEYIRKTPFFKNVDIGTYQVIKTFLHSEKILKAEVKKEEGKECVDMCKALEDLYQEGIDSGLEHGIMALVETCQEFGRTIEEAIQKVAEKFQVEQSNAEVSVRKYWK